MEKVSIVVPIYNAEKYIASCLESIVHQIYQNWEVLLINDGSTDRSGEICDQYAQADERIKVFHRKNCGVSATRNYGIEHATGRYIMFIDSDDAIEDNTLSDNVAKMEESGADVLIYGCRYHILDENRTIDKPLPEDFSGNGNEFFHRWYVPLLQMESLNPPWNKLIRREVLEQNSIRFHEAFSICEDMAFTVELLQKCNKISMNKGMYYNYNIKSTGSLVFKFHHNYFEALSYFFDKSMAYCEGFIENEVQKTSVKTIYANLAIMHIKQICIDSGWEKGRCLSQIATICGNEKLLESLDVAHLSTKKRIVRLFIKCKLYRAIYLLYRRG